MESGAKSVVYLLFFTGIIGLSGCNSKLQEGDTSVNRTDNTRRPERTNDTADTKMGSGVVEAHSLLAQSDNYYEPEEVVSDRASLERDEKGWGIYHNARYGYTVCYPPFFDVGREAVNGDGRSFRGPDGSTLSTFGTNNFMDESLRDHMTANSNADDVVTYAVYKSNWSVISGTRGPNIFWRKTYLRDNQFITAIIDYPALRKAQYGAVINSLNECFRPGSAPF